MTYQDAEPATTPMSEAADSTGFDNSNIPQGSPDTAAERPVRQLEAIIANLGTYAVPVLREVAARAAELAARAGQAAGPIAHKAADTTELVGSRVADKSRAIATDLRRGDTAATTSGDGRDQGSPDIDPNAPGSVSRTEAWAEPR